MQDRTADRPSLARGLAFAACALPALLCLAHCAATGGNLATLFVDPGKYQFSSCQSLANQRKTWADKTQELRLLMERAEQGAGGALVSVLAYQGDYVSANEELRLIESAARAKSCGSWQSNSAVQ
jgi:hypothetical protein